MKEKIITLICCALCVPIFLSACISPKIEAEPPAYTTDGPYYDEVTDPTFTGYPEIDHSDQLAQEPARPWTDEEVEMLAKTLWAECRGVPSRARQAAVAWCALNRLDAGTYGSTLAEVLSTPAQFAYYESSPVTPDLLELAEDVLNRWYLEITGADDVGRTLPADYLFFDGDGKENHFYQEWRTGSEEWDWSLPDPYEEAADE